MFDHVATTRPQGVQRHLLTFSADTQPALANQVEPHAASGALQAAIVGTIPAGADAAKAWKLNGVQHL